MDREERLAYDYFVGAGHHPVVYEPDGNVPPDFLLDGRIAVEVRRLNQNIMTPKGPRGLEEDEIPLLLAVRKALLALGPPTDGRSWFVWYSFRRPLPPIRTIIAQLTDWLQTTDLSADASVETVLPCGVSAGALRAAGTYDTQFRPGYTADEDSGGMLVEEMKNNIVLCMDEKAEKIEQRSALYPEWWLALVDYIGYGLDPVDRADLAREIEVTSPWARLLIVNPLDAKASFFLA